MRNYIWISEFKKQDFINKLEFFDDEYFVVLRNNQPAFILYPNMVSKDFESKFKYKINTCSARDLLWKNDFISPETVSHILKDNKHYYNKIPYWLEEGFFLQEKILEKVKKDLHKNIQISENS